MDERNDTNFEPFEKFELNYDFSGNLEKFLEQDLTYINNNPYIMTSLHDMVDHCWSTSKLQFFADRKKNICDTLPHIYAYYYLLIPSLVISNNMIDGAHQSFAALLSAFYRKNFQNRNDQEEINRLVHGYHNNMIHHIIFYCKMEKLTIEEESNYDIQRCQIHPKDIMIVCAATFSYDKLDGTYCHWINVELDKKFDYTKDSTEVPNQKDKFSLNYFGNNLGTFVFVYNQNLLLGAGWQYLTWCQVNVTTYYPE